MAKVILAEMLKRKSLSKRKFAKGLGIDYSSVFRYFRKGYDPKFSTLEKWAKVLRVRIVELIEE